MLQRNVLLTGAMAALIGLTIGCEWTGTDSEEAWNDAYSWANFSGTYHLYNVLDPTETTTDDQVTVTEGLGHVIKGSRTYPIKTDHYPILAGSVTVRVGDYTANDDGSQVLSGAGVAGSISYGTGEGSVTLVDTPGDVDNGKPISITYTYLVSGTVTTPGSEITLFTVNQQGNLLTFTDNNGVAYSGRVTGANVPSDSRSSGNVRLNFEVTAANKAKIIGTLSGDWSGGATGTLANRLIRGTYSRGGTHVELQGASGSITITPRPITTD